MDLHTLAFVVASTKEGKTHEQVLSAWEEFDNFEWDLPESTTEATGDTSTALVPMAALQAAQALMIDAQRREQEAREQAQQRERELLAQVNQLQRELGKAEGKIEALQTVQQKQQEHPQQPQSRSWWTRLLGVVSR
jgi:hypothetical protein